MPIIYTKPFNLGRLSGNAGRLCDGDPTTYFTLSGTQVFPLESGATINTIIAISGRGVGITTPGFTAHADNPIEISGDRDFHLFTFSGTQISAAITATGRVYEVYAMRELLRLENSDSMALTLYNPNESDKDRYAEEDLYGNVSVESGPGSGARRSDSFEVWFRGDDLTACMKEYNKLKYIYQVNDMITLWAMTESGATDYESVYPGHFVSGSLAYRIQGVNAISYTFSIEGR